MLPFLKKTKEASIAIPSEAVKRDPDIEPEFDSLESAGQDLIDSIHAKDAKAVATAFRAAFDLLETQPHEEISHE